MFFKKNRYFYSFLQSVRSWNKRLLTFKKKEWYSNQLIFYQNSWTALLTINYTTSHDGDISLYWRHMGCFLFHMIISSFSILLFCSVRGRKSSEERYGQSLCPHSLCSQYVCSASIRWPADEPARYAAASSTQRSRRHATPQWLRSRLRRCQLRWPSFLFLIGWQLPSHFFCSSQNPSVAIIGISQLTDNMSFMMTSISHQIFFLALMKPCLNLSCCVLTVGQGSQVPLLHDQDVGGDHSE